MKDYENAQLSSIKITSGIYLYNLLNGKFLICHASKSKDSWTIPKGLKESDENIFQAASRELFEETNINLQKINVLRVHPLPAVRYEKRKKILESFLVISRFHPAKIKLRCHTNSDDKIPEIDNYKWVDIDEFELLIQKTQVKNLGLIRHLALSEKRDY